MPAMKDFLSSDTAVAERQWDVMSNARRAAYVLNKYDVLTKDDGKIGNDLEVTEEELATMWAEYQGLKQWADYEEQLNSILERDLVADVNALKLFDNTRDPRDPSNHPEPPENIRDQAALLWPFK